MSEESTNFREMRDLVYMTYLRCPVQKIAVRRVVQEIQRGKLAWAHESKTGKIHQKKIMLSTKEHKIWSNFIGEIIVQLKVFGYAVYRMVKVRGAKSRTSQFKGETNNTMNENVRLEVANGQGLTLVWNEEFVEWDVFADGDFATPMKRNKWHVIFFHPPHRVGSNNHPVLASAAAGCQVESALYADLKRRINERDEINTRPCVYTSVSRNLMSSNQSSRPWFHNTTNETASAHIAVPGMQQDFNTLLRDRLDTLKELDTLSKEARESTRRAYESGHRVQLHKMHEDAYEDRSGPVEATEMFITDGREAREMTQRHGPPEVHQVIDRLVKEIYFCHDVTPQASGMSGSSERLTSSDRLARIAISVTEHHISQIRTLILQAIRKISSQLSGDESGRTYVQIVPCLNMHNLQLVESFLNIEALVDAYTCVMEGLPSSSIDVELLKKRQTMLLEQGSKSISNKSTEDGEKSQRMTEEQKTARLNSKAQ